MVREIVADWSYVSRPQDTVCQRDLPVLMFKLQEMLDYLPKTSSPNSMPPSLQRKSRGSQSDVAENIRNLKEYQPLKKAVECWNMPPSLKSHIADFTAWLNGGIGEAPTWKKEREERLAWYRNHLAKDRFSKLTREDVATLIKKLWATNFWKNKDYKAEKFLKDNGLAKLRLSLETLLHGNDPIDKRWDEFHAAIKGLGPSSISEILTFSDPQQYSLINLKPYEVLPRIGFSLSTVKDGKSYARAVEEIGKVKLLLSESGLKDADFIQTDFFIAYLFCEVFDLEHKRRTVQPLPPSVPKGEQPPSDTHISGDVPIESHEGAQAMLLSLGKILDFDTYTADPSKQFNGQKLGDLATLEALPDFAPEKAMESARRVDVVWVTGEWPEYFFEVEQSTGVTPGLQRMYQVIRVDAKFFIVAPGDEDRRRFDREVAKDPYKVVKHKYRFRSYDELREMYRAASNYRKTSDHFLG